MHLGLVTRCVGKTSLSKPKPIDELKYRMSLANFS
jgi:hypothetical protein